jgi:hypothetical protein
MNLRTAVFLGFFLLVASNPAAACTSPNGHSANYSMVRLSFNASGMPAAVQQGINDAAAAWNATGCNDGDDFPIFFTSGSAEATLQVIYDPNISPIVQPNGETVCSSINAAMDGSSGTITLYGQIRLANGQTYDCFTNSAIAADTIAHELGHYLGLDETDCGGYIMSPRARTISNGQITWDTSRQVRPGECGFVDGTNMTSIENNNETTGDPICNAYCWTTCIGSLCPEEHPGCPILVDLENDGIRLTGIDDPVQFDIDADGTPDLMSWTDRGEGMLALDRNGNGVIDDGGELFGNATRLADGTLAPNGYVALAELDSWTEGGDENGVIDAADAAFTSLWMWTDLNHDGISQPEELQTLEEAGIVRMDLDYKRSHRTDRYGNEFRFLGRAWKENRRGIVRPVQTWDVFFLVVH